ncbi:uncharacterized protein ACWYII_041222 isoform 1-T2 [Salvelinus alpinus]
MGQGLQIITDYKGKTSHVADTFVLLPDKLNTFFARFEDNTVPPTRPAPKDYGLSFSVAESAVPACFKMSTIVPVPKTEKVPPALPPVSHLAPVPGDLPKAPLSLPKASVLAPVG